MQMIDVCCVMLGNLVVLELLVGFLFFAGNNKRLSVYWQLIIFSHLALPPIQI